MLAITCCLTTAQCWETSAGMEQTRTLPSVIRALVGRLTHLHGPFTASLFGDHWQPGPVSQFATLWECRTWAIDNTPFADRCSVVDSMGRPVREWVRSSDSDDFRWRQVSRTS